MSQDRFDKMCLKRKINDYNVDDLTNEAFISITGTNGYIPDKHYFLNNHKNVLNVEFDDVDKDTKIADLLFKAITQEQADRIVNFIAQNIGKDFYIHCTAGISRSGAVGSFIHDFFNNDNSVELIHRGIHPNVEVLAKLKRSLYYNEYGDNIN